MNRRSILTKTGKGLMEATGKTSNLSRDLRNVLKEIDGKVSVSVLLERLDKFTEPKLLDALGGLERDGYVREFLGPQDTGGYAPVGRAPISQAPSDLGEDLDFTSFNPKSVPRQREEAAARAKAEALARAKIEAEQKARAALAQQLRPESRPPPSQDSGQARVLDQARRDAEERQRRESEEKGRREAEARARFEAEERVRREVEERQRAEVHERTRREDEERARREAETRARREAEERARKEIEDRRRREIEDKLRQEEVERRLREEQERARREAQEKERRLREEREHAELMVRVEAEARAKVEAEERDRREREERARRAEEEGRRRKEAQEREARERMRGQEEAARRELEEKIREEEERERREQEERARAEEEEKEKAALEGEEDILKDEDEEALAKQEARRVREEAKEAREEERARAKAAEHLGKAHRSRERAGEEVFRGDEGALVQERARAARSPGSWRKERSGSPVKMIAAMLLIILIVAAAVIPFVPLESAPYEKAAQDWLGVPVKIGSVSVVLVPKPHLKFEKIVIGGNPQMRIATVKAMPEIASLMGDRKAFGSLELEGVVFPSKYVPVFLSDKGKGHSLRVANISVRGLKLDIPDLSLPPFDVNAKLGADGTVQSVVLSNAERRLSVILTPQGKRATIEISADAFPLPVGGDLVLEEFLAKGTVTAVELALSEVEARAFGGRLQGNARVRWTDGWALDGEVSARGVEAANLAGPLLAGGVLEGKGIYGMKAPVPERLFASARFEGNFNIQKGAITNVDMTRLLQGSSTGGGTTLFSEMTGVVSADPNRLVVRQLRLAAGLLNGAGQVEMDPQKNLSGRIQIELRAQTVQARASLGIGGTLKNPQFRRAN